MLLDVLISTGLEFIFHVQVITSAHLTPDLTLDYEQARFPSLIRRANVKKSVSKINRRLSFSLFFAAPIYLADSVSLARRTKLVRLVPVV